MCYNLGMRLKRQRRGRKVLILLITAIIIALAAFFGFQFVTKTGLFRVPGIVYYDEGLNDSDLEILHNIFTEEVDLDKDVHITAKENNTRPTLSEGEFLYEIRVPVADYYETREDISEYASDEYRYIPFEELDFKSKLLSIDDKYYLDTFDSGAIFRTIKFDSELYDQEIKPLIGDKFVKKFPEKDDVLTFAQTGVTALSRGMNAKLYQVGDATYFSEKIKDYLSSFDITHTSNESSFTNYATGDNICSDPRFIDTLTSIGLDIVELTGNHNLDCGIQSAIDSIDKYNELGIKTVGGGKNADDASSPLIINQKNSSITFLAYNLSTGGATHDNIPGANQYYEENAASEISAAKERGDFVIVDVQYYECSAYASEYEDATCDFPQNTPGDEIGLFRHLVDLGADIVVGTSAHQPQVFEQYGDGAIYYGLGNIFFDQAWWPGTTRSLILAHYFYNGKLLSTKVVPTVYNKNLQPELLDKETARWFLNRLISERP